MKPCSSPRQVGVGVGHLFPMMQLQLRAKVQSIVRKRKRRRRAAAVAVFYGQNSLLFLSFSARTVYSPCGRQDIIFHLHAVIMPTISAFIFSKDKKCCVGKLLLGGTSVMLQCYMGRFPLIVFHCSLASSSSPSPSSLSLSSCLPRRCLVHLNPSHLPSEAAENTSARPAGSLRKDGHLEQENGIVLPLNSKTRLSLLRKARQPNSPLSYEPQGALDRVHLSSLVEFVLLFFLLVSDFLRGPPPLPVAGHPAEHALLALWK